MTCSGYGETSRLLTIPKSWITHRHGRPGYTGLVREDDADDEHNFTAAYKRLTTAQRATVREVVLAMGR